MPALPAVLIKKNLDIAVVYDNIMTCDDMSIILKKSGGTV